MMMISEKTGRALNKQVMNELHASHTYLAMSLAFRDMGLKVFAGHFLKQAEEERGHAMKIINYLHDVGAPVRLDNIAKPEGHFETAAAIVKDAVQAEQNVTRQINELVAMAETEKDYATRSFLQWFVDEQVEEVSSMSELLQWIEMAGDRNLFLVEARLAAAK
jgi:ferritin